MRSEAQEGEWVRRCLLLAASGGVAGEDEAPSVLWLEVVLCNKQSAAVGSVGVDVSKVTVLQAKGLWAPQTLQVHTGVEML